MLIDTSRDGWGRADRPAAVSTSTDLNTHVDDSRVDRRPQRGDGCNQKGAGIDAYVWVKPPGESDGVSQAGITDPGDPNKKFSEAMLHSDSHLH